MIILTGPNPTKYLYLQLYLQVDACEHEQFSVKSVQPLYTKSLAALILDPIPNERQFIH